MQSYWIRNEGSGTVLERREVPQPVPGPGQVLIKVRAASLNRGDLLGTIRHHRTDIARPAGVDGAGEVVALGPGVSGTKVGDRVMVRAKGMFAEYALVDIEQIAPMPASLGFEQAAACPIAYITAYEALIELGGLKAGEWTLIAGVSSGVGVCAVQLAKAWGAKVIGVSGSQAKLDRIKPLGLDAAIRARAEDYARQAIEASGGQGVDLAVNLVGGTAFPSCLGALRNHGRLAMVGYVDGKLTAEIDLEAVHGKRLHVFGVSNAALTPAMRANSMRDFIRDVVPLLADKRIVPQVDRVFPLAELPQAKAYVESDAVLGKVVVNFS